MKLSNLDADPDNEILRLVYYCVLFGFVSLTCDYIGHVFWDLTAEKRIRRMKYSKKNLNLLVHVQIPVL